MKKRKQGKAKAKATANDCLYSSIRSKIRFLPSNIPAIKRAKSSRFGILAIVQRIENT